VFTLPSEEAVKVEEKYLCNHILFVKMYMGNVVVGVRSICEVQQGLFLSEISCKNLIKYSKIVNSLLLGHESSYQYIYDLYCNFVVDVKHKYTTYIDEFAEEEEMVPDSLVHFVRKQIDLENEHVSQDFKHILYELGPENIVLDL
jgi:hypothetical protein